MSRSKPSSQRIKSADRRASRGTPVRRFAFFLALLFSAVLVTGLEGKDDVAVIAPSSEVRELAKSESELAAIERRGTAVRPAALPLILYSAENEMLRHRATSLPTSALDQARRIAARYSIMNLEAIPLPLFDAVAEQPDLSYDLRPDSRRLDKPIQPEGDLDGWGNPDARTSLWSEDDIADERSRGFFHEDLVGPIVRPMTPREKGVLRLARKVASRQTRKFFRKDLKDRHEIDPTFTYEMYRSERDVIWQLGRGRTFSATKKRSAEFRSEALDDDKVLERVDLIDWGPFRVDDSGSLGIDVKRLVRRSRPALELAPDTEEEDDEPQGESLFSGKSYRVDTDVRFTPHFSQIGGGNLRDFFGKVKAGVSVDFLDPLLHRRYLSTEIETWHKPNGQSAVFMNFVIWGK